MTDLDRQIAEIKGWVYSPAGTTARIRIRRQGGQEVALPEGFWQGSTFHSAMNCDWSGSDSKALELVDELATRFELVGQGTHWMATFWMRTEQGLIPDFVREVGLTRPEAICRAYIAAQQWLNSRKKEA